MFAEAVGLAVELGGAGLAAEGDFADVVGAGVEGRVDVDEVDGAAVAVGEEVGEDLFVVAVEELAGGGGGEIGGCGVEALDVLGGESGDGAERFLPIQWSRGRPLAAAIFTSAVGLATGGAGVGMGAGGTGAAGAALAAAFFLAGLAARAGFVAAFFLADMAVSQGREGRPCARRRSRSRKV